MDVIHQLRERILAYLGLADRLASRHRHRRGTLLTAPSFARPWLEWRSGARLGAENRASKARPCCLP
jgi:hypothetical protein